MLIGFGKHAGKTVEELFLTDPDYLVWALGEQDPSAALAEVAQEARRLIDLFDRKPLAGRCHKCENPAAHCALFVGDSRVYGWCDICRPFSLAIPGPRFHILRTFQDAHILSQMDVSGRLIGLGLLIRALAHHKGHPERFGAGEAAAFFPPAAQSHSSTMAQGQASGRGSAPIGTRHCEPRGTAAFDL